MQETTKFWQSNDLGQHIDLLRATYFNQRFAPHIHEGYAFGVIEQGAEQFDYWHKHWVAPAGSIVVIHPGEMHTGNRVDDAGWSYRMFYPEVALLERAVKNVANKTGHIPFFDDVVIQDPWLFNKIRQLHHILEQSQSQLEREMHLLWTTTHLVMRHGDIRPYVRPITDERSVMARVKEYIHANFNQNISLDDLAQVAHLSPYHFSRVFRKTVGLPPHTYLIQVRVERAKLLLTQNQPISQVAHDVGFTDQSHLTRHFKRIVGVPPGQYRFG